MKFTIDNPPITDDAQVLRQWTVDQFERLEGILNKLNATVLHAEPSKPENGDIQYADGTDWNPGSGEGFYGRENGAWVKL